MTDEHKSEKIQQIADENDWETKLDIDIPESDGLPNYSEISWTLYAAREEETLKVVWRGNRQDFARYKYGSYVSDLPHKAAVMSVLCGEPDPLKYHDTSSLSPEQLLKVRKLPWKDDAPAIQILKSTANKTIRWVRSLDNEVCEAMVTVDFNEPGSLKNFRVFEAKSGNRTLEWSDRFGFHAVSLNRIVSVG